MKEQTEKHPDRNTLRGLKLAIDIFAKHLDDGLGTKHCIGADHEIIFGPANSEEIPPESEDGKTLQSLGWFYDETFDCWANFV